MSFEALQSELDAKLAAMSDDELIGALEKAGCVFAEPWLDSFSNSWAPPVQDDGVSVAANSNELALAA